MPLRLLFLNTRDSCGADVAVHLSLMAHLPVDQVHIFVVSNSEASDAEEMRQRFAQMPQVTAMFMPLGRPAAALVSRSKVAKFLAYLPSVWSLLKTALLIKRLRIQVVHATDRPRDASYVSALGYLSPAKSVVHMHAPVTELSSPTRWGMKHADAIFAVSESIRQDLIRTGLPDRKIFTVHNAVDANFFDPDLPVSSDPDIRASFGIPTNAPLIGIAARMNPWKGQIELIGAVAQLRDRFPDLHVLILGADVPEMRAEYERLALQGGVASRIHYGGFQKDVRPFLKEFDLFVHPSYGEPFGLSIVEAMAMRRPVVACGTGGVPEIITHGVDGWLVEERSIAAVAEAIEALLTDNILCRSIGLRARQTVLDRFMPKNQCNSVLERYAGLVTAT